MFPALASKHGENLKMHLFPKSIIAFQKSVNNGRLSKFLLLRSKAKSVSKLIYTQA
jgi:hypothetical protein